MIFQFAVIASLTALAVRRGNLYF